MALREVFARNLRRLRSEQGYSQEALADLVRIHRTYISALERQRHAATLDVLERISRALDVSPCNLLQEQDGAADETEARR